MKHLCLTLFAVLTLAVMPSPRLQSASAADIDPAARVDLHGGLIVQLGGEQTDTAEKLSLTGRYLVHLLDPDAGVVEVAQKNLRKNGYYGLTWAEHPVDRTRLPYTENIVNLIVVQSYQVSVEELKRVLTPGGHVVVLDQKLLKQSELANAGFEIVKMNDGLLVARKPVPAAMDSWSHPRHAADGNAVSQDKLVGPPSRVRWIAAATSEVEGMVTAGGRNFYGGILARDSFNGLRLWHCNQKEGGLNQDEFELPKATFDAARPIASERLVFTVLKDQVVALNAATGEIVVELGNMTNPAALIHEGGRVIAADEDIVRAFDAATGQEIWNVAAVGVQNVVTDGRVVAYLQGRVRRGEPIEAVAVRADTGEVIWKRSDYTFLKMAKRTVLASGQLVFEVSTLNDHDADNGIHVVDAMTGEHQWSKDYAPGMNHMRQARAMFLDGDLWILHGGKINTAEKEQLKREPVQISALDPRTGETRKTYPAGLTHCFPPVATPNFMFAGELDMTNLQTGEVIANRITKANCSRENGWVPANGLIYTTPKHCTCWPMLRGYVAMAPDPPSPTAANLPLDQLEFLLEKGTATIDPNAARPAEHDWPLYRHDRWRSAAATTDGPSELKQRWSLTLHESAEKNTREIKGPILHDWKDNPVIKSPLSPPTIANGIAYVTRPNAHELIAIDTSNGAVRWRFTANGRLDTPPAIHRGLCLFGSAMGWVYALRADTGEMVWRMRAAPTDERIVAYGQVESPWPVPGAVLVMDDVAYFAAGRQPLADGGILVFAIDPMTGERHWVQRIDSVPQKGFYENSGLEFDPFDILHAEGEGLAMSRWILSPDGKDVSVDKWNAFAKLNTGAGEVWIPRGAWTYGARHQDRFRGEAPRRPLIAFRDQNIFSSLDGSTEIFRREFGPRDVEEFNSKWITGWEAAQKGNRGDKPYRNYRIAEGAKWTLDPFVPPGAEKENPKPGTQLHNRVHAMALAGNGELYVVHEDGRLKVLSTEHGYTMRELQVPTPAWDGVAIAEKRVFLTTQDGRLICLGEADTATDNSQDK